MQPENADRYRLIGISRSSSNARTTNDRLQERLARAVAKNATSSARSGSPASSTGLPSRSTTPHPALESPRSSLDSKAPEALQNPDNKDKEGTNGNTAKLANDSSDVSAAHNGRSAIPSGVGEAASTPEPSINTPPSVPTLTVNGSDASVSDSRFASMDIDENDVALMKLRAEHEASEQRWQDQLNEYIERIDALQAKIQYLSKEATTSAKQAAAEAIPGSLEQSLAEKDAQYAMLMEEGQRLSKRELQHMNTIKKLRAKVTESEKLQTTFKASAEDAEQKRSTSDRKLKMAQQRAKETELQLEIVQRAGKSASESCDRLTATVTDMRSQLAKAESRVTEAESKAQNDVTEKYKKRISELEDDLSSSKTEREFAEDRLRKENRELRDAVESEKDRARIRELDLQAEQSALEGRLEAMRERAEEASSGATTDAQVNLLRQIETLQTQYSVASENWQGIEGTMLSRITRLEQERDELTRKESDLRKKARDAVWLLSRLSLRLQC